MSLIIFKYCLPILLGYTIYSGVTGRLLPYPKPTVPSERPIWFLGLWMGIGIALIGLIGLQLAYRTHVNDLPALVSPALWITAIAMTPGIIGFFWYRSKVAGFDAQTSAEQTIDVSNVSEDIQNDRTLAVDLALACALDDNDATVKISDTFILDTALLDTNHQYSSWQVDISSKEKDELENEETQLISDDYYLEDTLVLDKQVSAIRALFALDMVGRANIPAANDQSMLADTDVSDNANNMEDEIETAATLDLGALNFDLTAIDSHEFDVTIADGFAGQSY